MRVVVLSAGTGEVLTSKHSFSYHESRKHRSVPSELLIKVKGGIYIYIYISHIDTNIYTYITKTTKHTSTKVKHDIMKKRSTKSRSLLAQIQSFARSCHTTSLLFHCQRFVDMFSTRSKNKFEVDGSMSPVPSGNA